MVHVHRLVQEMRYILTPFTRCMCTYYLEIKFRVLKWQLNCNGVIHLLNFTERLRAALSFVCIKQYAVKVRFGVV